MKFALLSLVIVTAAAPQKSCTKDIPKWNKKIYAGNSIEGTIDRKQDHEQISTRDKKFDDMFCIKREDFDCLVETYIANARGWYRQSSCGLKP